MARLNPVEYVLAVFRGQAAVARIVGLSRQAVDRWLIGGKVPADHQEALLVAAEQEGLDLTARDLVLGRECDLRYGQYRRPRRRAS